MIAIAGGTGNLGRTLVPLLLDRGHQVRVLARHPETIPDAWRGRVEGVAVDVRQPASIGPRWPASRRSSRHHRLRRPRCRRRARVDGDGNLALIRAAEAAGVEHVILMSVAQSAPDHPIELFRAKFAAEQRLRESRLAWTIVQPTAYMETWVELLGRPLLNGEHVPGWSARGDNPINFVSAADVAFVVDAALSRSAAPRPDRRRAGPTERRRWTT